MRKILIFLSTMIVGCCPCRHLATTTQNSVSVEVVERVEWKMLPVGVAIPQEREERTVEADSSYLENSVAASWARVTPEGSLYHSLFTLPTSLKTSLNIPTLHRDSVVYRQQYREIVVEVAKPLTWWQQTQIKGFWVLIIAAVVILLWRKSSNHIRLK